MNPDLNSEIHCIRSIEPRVIMAGNATYTGQTIDRKGYESLDHVVIAGALTDATYTCTVYESNDSGMSGEAAVADADLIGQTNGFGFDYSTEDNAVKKVGYKGSKRYVRLKIVQAAATTGGYICAVAVQGKPRFLPTT